MKQQLQTILTDEAKAKDVAAHGLATIKNRHTCAHRINELEKICEELDICLEKIYLNQQEQLLHEE